jgi:alpha-L-rhamnosidase
MNHTPTQWGLPANWGGLSLIQAAGSGPGPGPGPAQWILKQIVGIKPYEPGFKITEIYPRPSYLKWAKGTVASPHGPISASWKKLNDKFQLNFNAPAAIPGDQETSGFQGSPASGFRNAGF